MSQTTCATENDFERLQREHRWRLKLEKAGFFVMAESYAVTTECGRVQVNAVSHGAFRAG